MGGTFSMCESLSRAILKEDWGSVEEILRQPRNHEAIRDHTYLQYARYAFEGRTHVSALHLACSHNPPETIVRLLLEICGTRIAHPSGENPLHCAVLGLIATHGRLFFGKGQKAENQINIGARVSAAVRVLLEETPQFVSQQSTPEFGSWTPLHLACMGGVPKCIVQMLCDADPHAAATIQDAQGRTSLHLACTAGVSTSIIGMLYNADPEAARSTRNNNGQTALQIAKKHLFIEHPVWRWTVGRLLKDAGTDHYQVAQDDPLEQDEGSVASERSSDESSTQEQAIDEEEATNAGADELLCVVCWHGQADHVLVPCGHMCLCSECSTDRTLRGLALQSKCPVCTRYVYEAVRVYHAGVPAPE